MSWQARVHPQLKDALNRVPVPGKQDWGGHAPTLEVAPVGGTVWTLRRQRTVNVYSEEQRKWFNCQSRIVKRGASASCAIVCTNAEGRQSERMTWRWADLGHTRDKRSDAQCEEDAATGFRWQQPQLNALKVELSDAAIARRVPTALSDFLKLTQSDSTGGRGVATADITLPPKRPRHLLPRRLHRRRRRGASSAACSSPGRRRSRGGAGRRRGRLSCHHHPSAPVGGAARA